MHYLILATDYDGTLATNGKVSDTTLEALKRLQKSGRKLILVTGRQLDDLVEVFPEVNLFDCAVVENGAVLYFPINREEVLLGSLPPEGFVQALRSQQIDPLSVGKVIVATWEPHEAAVLKVIRELGLDLQVIFNKGAVMVLPAGVNKASGLSEALNRMGLSVHNTVAIGDAENDLAFLKLSEFSVAVANALESVKNEVDWVTTGSRGDGVIELIDRLLIQDLQESDQASFLPERHRILLGKADQEVYIQPLNHNILLAGSSGGGKSTLATGMLERFIDQGYQVCIIDPEGDYQNFYGTIALGNAQQIPNPAEVLAILSKPEQNLVVNLMGVKVDDRPSFLAQLLPSLLEMRVRTGRPHWIIIDEVHHMFPTDWNTAVTLPQSVNGILMITVHPDHVAASILALIDTIIVVKSPMPTITDFCKTVGHVLPTVPLAPELAAGKGVGWFLTEGQPFEFEVIPPRQERQRHMRNYAEGTLGNDRCFYFKGEDGQLNLKAQNLIVFTQLAAGVDDRTWLYHLHRQDYSKWLHNSIKDETLAAAVSQIEITTDISPSESRDRIKSAIEKRYTLPI